MDKRLLNYFELTPENALIVKNNVYAECIIPKEDVTSGIVDIEGDMAFLIGHIDFYVWESSYTDDLKPENAKKVQLRLPNTIHTHPGRIREDKDLGVYVFQYHHGDKIVVNTQMEQSTATVVRMFKNIISKKIPNDVPYDRLPFLIEECARLNNYGLDANIVFIDLICMVVSRDPTNPARQFRERLNSRKGVSMFDRKLINIDDIPALVSQFGALSSGNAKQGITTTIGAIRSGEMEVEELDIEKAL